MENIHKTIHHLPHSRIPLNLSRLCEVKTLNKSLQTDGFLTICEKVRTLYTTDSTVYVFYFHLVRN